MESHPAASLRARAPCGPECRYAKILPRSYGEWLWCTRTGMPRSAVAATECPWFSPADDDDAPGAAPPADRGAAHHFHRQT